MSFLVKLAVYLLVLAALFLMACGRGARWAAWWLRFYYWKYLSDPPLKGPTPEWQSVSTSAAPSQRCR